MPVGWQRISPLIYKISLRALIYRDAVSAVSVAQPIRDGRTGLRTGVHAAHSQAAQRPGPGTTVFRAYHLAFGPLFLLGSPPLVSIPKPPLFSLSCPPLSTPLTLLVLSHPQPFAPYLSRPSRRACTAFLQKIRWQIIWRNLN